MMENGQRKRDQENWGRGCSFCQTLDCGRWQGSGVGEGAVRASLKALRVLKVTEDPSCPPLCSAVTAWKLLPGASRVEENILLSICGRVSCNHLRLKTHQRELFKTMKPRGVGGQEGKERTHSPTPQCVLAKETSRVARTKIGKAPCVLPGCPGTKGFPALCKTHSECGSAPR